MDGDGISEYVIESLTGVYCAAEDGELLWTKKSDRDTTAYAAVYREPGGDRDQALILAGVNMRNRQELRAFFYDHGGRLVRQVELPYRYRVNTVMEWRGRMAYFGDGMARDRKFGLAGFDGEILFEYEETHDVRPVHIVEARGVPVRLAKGSPPYLAVVSRFHRNASRSIFYIFSPEGRLLHKEVTMATIGLAVAQNADGATQAILASDGAGTLWSYKLAP